MGEFAFVLLILIMSFFLSINHSYTKLKLRRSIVDQKIAIDRLEKSELRLKNIIENANELIFTLSKNHIITYISPAWNKLLNYSISETIGRPWSDFIHAEDRELFTRIFNLHKSARNIEYRIIHNNGTWMWHRATCTPVYKDNDIQYYVILSQDIMENRQALEALRFSEERLHNIIDNANDIIFTMTSNGLLFFVSPVWQQLLGYDLSIVEGSSIFNYIHKEDVADLKQHIENIVKSAKNQRSIEYRIIHNNGTWFWHRSTLSAVKDRNGNIDYLVGINQDITQNKISEKKLLESEQRLEMALNGADLGLWDWNLITGEIVFNKEPYEILGIKIPFTTSNYHDAAKLIEPSDLEKGLHKIQDHIAGRIPNFESEYKLNLDKNNHIWVLVKGKVFERDSNGNAVRAVGTFMDITKTKNAALELKNSLNEKDILLREIHHRVKNNFQIIISLLNLQSADLADHNLKEFFHVYHNRIRSMALIHEKMYHSTELNAIDFSDYALSIVNEISSMYLDDDDIEITINSEIEPVYMDIDTAIPCGLILNEIITNIFKYAFPVTFSGEPCITLKINKKENNNIDLFISDNGIGIDNSVDIDHTETLGLKLIYMLTENQLKGKVTLIKDPGTGFLISFPSKEIL